MSYCSCLQTANSFITYCVCTNIKTFKNSSKSLKTVQCYEVTFAFLCTCPKRGMTTTIVAIDRFLLLALTNIYDGNIIAL